MTCSAAADLTDWSALKLSLEVALISLAPRNWTLPLPLDPKILELSILPEMAPTEFYPFPI